MVQYNGYTSVMGAEGTQYPGEWQMKLYLASARDIQPFSVAGDPEFLLPRGVQLRYLGFDNGYRTMRETAGRKNIKKSRQFGSSESWDDFFVRTAIEDGYTRERAIEILKEMKETQERWESERGKPVGKERLKKLRDIYDRMQAEATAGLKE